MKLKALLTELGFVGLVSKTGFVKSPPASMRGPKTSIKEEEDWYGDDPGAPEPMYGDDDQFDDKAADHDEFSREEDTDRITDIYGEGSELLDDVGMKLEMFSEQIDENLEQLYDTSGDMVYKQQKGVIKKYFNNILRNIELTKKHLDAGF